MARKAKEAEAEGHGLPAKEKLAKASKAKRIMEVANRRMEDKKASKKVASLARQAFSRQADTAFRPQETPAVRVSLARQHRMRLPSQRHSLNNPL